MASARATGTDADVIHFSRDGVVTGGLAPGAALHALARRDGAARRRGELRQAAGRVRAASRIRHAVQPALALPVARAYDSAARAPAGCLCPLHECLLVDSPIPRHGRVAVTTACLGLVAALLFAASAWAPGRGRSPPRSWSGRTARSAATSARSHTCRSLPGTSSPSASRPRAGSSRPERRRRSARGRRRRRSCPRPGRCRASKDCASARTAAAFSAATATRRTPNGDVGPDVLHRDGQHRRRDLRQVDGSRVAGFSFNALMSQGKFGNLCDTDNFGDPVVLYDSFHDRWVITDFAFQLDSSGSVVSPPGVVSVLRRVTHRRPRFGRLELLLAPHHRRAAGLPQVRHLA